MTQNLRDGLSGLYGGHYEGYRDPVPPFSIRRPLSYSPETLSLAQLLANMAAQCSKPWRVIAGYSEYNTSILSPLQSASLYKMIVKYLFRMLGFINC